MPGHGGFESVVINAPSALLRFLTVPKALTLRLLSKKIRASIDASEEFWLSILSRAGLLSLYWSCVPSPIQRPLFLQLIANDTTRWQRFDYTKKSRESSIASRDVRFSKIWSTRAARIANHFEGLYKCKCSVVTGCICDTGARLLIETEVKDQIRVNTILGKTIELMDKAGRLCRADDIARRALPPELSFCRTLACSQSPSAYALKDGSLAFVWRNSDDAAVSGSIISLHLSTPKQIPYLRHLTIPTRKTVTAVAGRSVFTRIVVGCSDSTIYIFNPEESEPEVIEPSELSNLPLMAPERLDISETDDVIAVAQRDNMRFKFFERNLSDARASWRLVLDGLLLYKDNQHLTPIEWDLRNPSSTGEGGRGFSGTTFQRKNQKNTPRSISLAPTFTVIAEAVTPYAGGVLCFPIISARDEARVFPTNTPTNTTARIYNLSDEGSAHAVELHYFPPKGPFIVEPFILNSAVESALVIDSDDNTHARYISQNSEIAPASPRTLEKTPVVISTNVMPSFIVNYKIGLPRQILRWRGCWIACTRNIIRLFDVSYHNGVAIPLTTLAGHDSKIYRADLDCDLSRLITVEDDEVAIIWDLCKGKKIKSLDLLKVPGEDDDESDDEPTSELNADLDPSSTAESPPKKADREEPVQRLPPEPLLPRITPLPYYEDDFPSLGGSRGGGGGGGSGGGPPLGGGGPPLGGGGNSTSGGGGNNPSLGGGARAGSAPVMWGKISARARKSASCQSFEKTIENRLGKVRLSGAILAESDCPPDLVELSRLLNVPLYQLLADHARQAVWDSAKDCAKKPISKNAITSIARKLAKEFVPSKFWEDKVLNAPNPASRRAACRDKMTSSLKHALKEMKVRNGCVSNLWLTHSTLTLYYDSLSQIQTWYFLEDDEVVG